MGRRYAELLDTVLSEGILWGTDSQPIHTSDGQTARWMLDTLNFSMSARASRLAARALIDRLETFEGTRLATFGTTGIPLMQAVILESKGRYSGLIIRKEVKPHGARLRIQGPAGKGPVILIDDSMSSGTSLRKAREYLEAAGHEVEGAVVLVRFGYDGTANILLNDRLRVEAVFDTQLDLLPKMKGEHVRLLNPGKWFPDFKWQKSRAREGLHPTALARRTIEDFLRLGSVPRAPRRLDADYDGKGGVFVSLRRRSDIHDRPARGGFWHFPEEKQASLPEELIRASITTARLLAENAKDPAAVLADCAIAVTFFSRLEPCQLGDLDNDRYGIVVRSRVRRGVMGGALPRMPGIRDGWYQFRHAAWKNGQLYQNEPYELLRHDLTKHVEPGEAWQPTGVPKAAASAEDSPLSALAHAWVLFHLGRAPRPEPTTLTFENFAQVFVSPHVDGAVTGCAGQRVDPSFDPNAVFDSLAAAALKDPRFPERNAPPEANVTTGVSLLTLDLDLGVHVPATVMVPTKFGVQALEVEHEGRTGILLPHVVVTHDLDPQEYAAGVVEKAGAPAGEVHWTRFDCASWVADAKGETPLIDGLPKREEKDGDPAKLGGWWATFLERHSTLEGEPINRYLPFRDAQLTGVMGARLAHSAWIKARLGLKDFAKADLARATDESPPTLAFTALALKQLGSKKKLRAVTQQLVSLVGSTVLSEDQDFAPGQVLYALAETVGKDADVVDALGHYRRRFRTLPGWSSMAWLTMAFASWSRELNDPRLLDFAWDIVDWALQSQAPHGGFWTLQQSDSPGASTAVSLEACCALLPALRRAGKKKKAARLEQHIRRGFAFLSRLTYLPKDAGLLPNPDFALGGLRMSLTAGEVRLDFVQHALSAVLFLP